jgi:hypothetical protein
MEKETVKFQASISTSEKHENKSEPVVAKSNSISKVLLCTHSVFLPQDVLHFRLIRKVRL